MALITFDDKDKTLPVGVFRHQVRDVDMNELKDVINANWEAFLAAIGDDPDFANTISSALAAHIGNTSNPHGTTKAQVGLSDADNTSDLGKPVSTAQQTAIDAKVSNDLTASATVAPSKNAVNTALGLKTAFLSFAKRVALTGTQNGVNNTFGIPQPIVLDSEEFFRNGSLQVSPDDYTISGQTITTVVPPESWETLRTNYIRP